MILSSNLMPFLLPFAINLLSQVTLAAEVPICDQDSDCTFSCCNIDQQFYSQGKCVEISDWPRCKDRKTNYNIALGIYLCLFVIFFAICGVTKRK